MLVLNVLPSDGKNKPVEVTHLDNLSKANILKRWEECLAYPDRYVVALAESTKKMAGDTAAKDLVTLGEYLDSKGIEMDKGDYKRLATKVAQMFTEVYMVRPRIVARPDINGRFTNKSYAYEDTDTWIIDECLKSVKHTRKPCKVS